MRTIRLRLEDETYEKLELRALEREFDVPEEYATMILEVVIDELESRDERGMEDRLRDLGYID